MRKTAKGKWGIIPHNELMLRLLIIVFLVINIGANANEINNIDLEIPTKGNVSYNDNFFFCTIASDEAFLKMVNNKRLSTNKQILVNFVDNNFSNNVFYEFYRDMVDHVYASKRLSIEDDSYIFFKKCMNMAYQ